MPKICFVCDAFISDPKATITGPMVQTYLLGKEFHRRGWAVEYVTYSRQGKDGLTEIHENLKVRWVGYRRFLPLLNYWKIRRALAEADADFYYQRGRDILSGVTHDHCRHYGKKFIWASAGESGVEKDKYMTRLKRRHRPFYRFMPLWIEAKLNDRICNRGIKNADHLLVQTVYQKERLRETYGRDSVVIKSGHPVPDRIERQAPFKALWIGSIKKVKRPELFLELAEMCKDLECEFWMAGQMVDESYRAMIEKATRTLPRFRYLGPIPFLKSQETIAKAHILVNTTDDGYEGLPNAFVQAWLAGTVVLSRHADPDGGVTKEQTGFVDSNMQAMANHLREMTLNMSVWELKSSNAISYGLRTFTLDQIAGEISNRLLGQIT